LALPPCHGLKGRILRRFGHPLNDARILHGEKSFGYANIQQNREYQRTHCHCQGQALVLQYPVEFFFIPGEQTSKKAAVSLLRVVTVMLLGPQHDGAEHGCERERNNRRNKNGHGQRYRKFAEQPPHHIPHEQQGNKHRHQRNGQRNNGKAYLPCPGKGGLHGFLPLLKIARDIFNHHNGVIHHKAGGDNQSHEREIVQRVPGKMHDAKGAHQRKRHSQSRNNGGPGIAQKQPDNPDHQRHSQQQFKLHIVYRGADGCGAVRNHAHVHIAGQGLFEHGQKPQNPVCNVYDVGSWLALHREHDCRPKAHALPCHIGCKAGVFRTFHHFGHVAQAQRAAVLVADYGLGIGIGRGKLIVGVNGAGPFRAVKAALGIVDVGLGNGRAHVRQGKARIGQRLGVHLHPHGGALPA